MFVTYTQQVVAIYPHIFGASILCLALIAAVVPFVCDKDSAFQTFDDARGFLLLVAFWPIIPPLAFLIVICLAGFAAIGLTYWAASHIRSTDAYQQIIKDLKNNA